MFSITTIASSTTNAIDGLDHVRARLAENHQHDAGAAVDEAGVAHILHGIADCADVAQTYRGTVAPGNDEWSVFIRLEQLIGGRDAPRMFAAGQLPLRPIRIRRTQRVP